MNFWKHVKYWSTSVLAGSKKIVCVIGDKFLALYVCKESFDFEGELCRRVAFNF